MAQQRPTGFGLEPLLVSYLLLQVWAQTSQVILVRSLDEKHAGNKKAAGRFQFTT